MNKDTLKQMIIDTIKEEEHLGVNLKEQCVDYIEQLQNNWNELKKWIDSICFCDNDTITYEQISDKMQEVEQGKDE